MPPAGFEPAIPAGERPQNHALVRAANGVGPWGSQDVFCRMILTAFRYCGAVAGSVWSL